MFRVLSSSEFSDLNLKAWSPFKAGFCAWVYKKVKLTE